MSNGAIKAISDAAKDWDIACEILASGGSLADATRALLVSHDMASFDSDPVSVRVDTDDATAKTVAPKK